MSKMLSITTKDGKTFRSIREACAAIGVSRSTVRKRVKAGVDLLDAIDPTFSREKVSSVTINGKFFKRKIDAANHYGIKYQKFIDRLAAGWTLEEAVELSPRQHTISVNQTADKLNAFAASLNLTPMGAKTRLYMRRKRFRKWLELPPIDNSAHKNAIHLRDDNDNWFYSIKKASEHYGVSPRKVRKITKAVNEDLIYGPRHTLDDELVVSIDTLLLLLSHENVLKRETTSERLKTLRLDNNVVANIEVNALGNTFVSSMIVNNETMLTICVNDGVISNISGSALTIRKRKALTANQLLFAGGCSITSLSKIT